MKSAELLGLNHHPFRAGVFLSASTFCLHLCCTCSAFPGLARLSGMVYRSSLLFYLFYVVNLEERISLGWIGSTLWSLLTHGTLSFLFESILLRGGKQFVTWFTRVPAEANIC